MISHWKQREHYFCGSRLTEAFQNQATVACPVYKLELTDAQVKPPTRMILRFIEKIKVGCKKCKMQLSYEDAASPVCSPPAPTPALAGASHPRLLPAPAVVPAVPVQPAAAVLTLQDSI